MRDGRDTIPVPFSCALALVSDQPIAVIQYLFFGNICRPQFRVLTTIDGVDMLLVGAILRHAQNVVRVKRHNNLVEPLGSFLINK